MLENVVKIFAPTTLAFFLGVVITPIATHFFYKYKMWKKFSRNGVVNSTYFPQIHDEEAELHTPRVGGIIIWASVLLTVLIFYLTSLWFPNELTTKMNFLSRNQTLIPFWTLLLGALVGLWDDLIQIYGHGKIAHDHASWRKWKVLLISVPSILVGVWFFYKLGITSVHIPFNGELYLGLLVIPFFLLVALGTWSSGVIDGLDGLSGGVLASIFASYSAIAFANNQIDLAAFSGAITGATLAFLWFNVPPARFYMGETGIMSLTVTLATLAFLTESVLILPLVALPLVMTSLSVILQTASKKFRGGKRIFLLAPLHHHFVASGWPHYKVTMRYWIISVVCAILGVVIFIISK